LPRIPLTYPLTTQYYASLFAGELGFDLVKEFHADLNFGALRVSDVAATISLGGEPQVGWPPPGPLAAEEAFSVYDHPPVWIFAKRPDYSGERVREVLEQVDLDRAVFMTPGEATRAPNGLLLTESQQDVQRAGGTFASQFDLDSLLNQAPWLAAVLWWLALLLLSWLAVPVAFVVFGSLWDRGYALARILAPLLIAYFTWLAASLQIVPNDQNTMLGVILGLVLLSGLITWAQRDKLLSFLSQRSRYLIFVELLALALFVLFLAIRAGNPDVWDVIWGGEKPMDMSYFNAVLKSEYFPPYDPWYAGGYINYYYFGFVLVGVPTKLLGILPPIAYNLSLAMLFSFTGIAVFALAFNLVAAGKRTERIARFWPLPRKPMVAGLTAMTMAILLGNLGQPAVILRAWQRASDSAINTGSVLLDRIVRAFDGAIDLTLTDRVAPIYPGDWFWSASRVIQVPAGEVQPITEFPFFTFLYGDLHAHMIALPLTLVALSWAVNLALRQKPGRRSTVTKWWSLFEVGLIWGTGALSIGVLRATNTWDFPTYLLIALVAVFYSAYRRSDTGSVGAFGRALFQATALVVLSILFFLPFIDNYGVGYTSFSFWSGPYTSVVDYLAMFGLSLFIAAAYIFVEFRRWTRHWTVKTLTGWRPYVVPLFLALLLYVLLLVFMLARGYWIAPIGVSLAVASGLLALRAELAAARRVVLALITVAVTLTVAVEIIVLDGDIGRMNTVFKFYLQAWMLLGIAAGIGLVEVWPRASAKGVAGVAWRVTVVLLIGAAALYPPLATKAKWDTRMSEDAPATLDGMTFMQTTSYADTAFDGSGQTIDLVYDYDALRWMWQNIEGTPVIAEAHSGNPYRSIGNRVAMYTGLPTMVGWDWHQRQQRAVVPGWLITQRIYDVNLLYNTNDIAEALRILAQYDVGYIYVGQLEWTYYNPRGLLKFEQMMEQGFLDEVYRNSGVSIYAVTNTGLASIESTGTAVGQLTSYANR
ncbi:MAG: DUF2298 domain-containing protein, partial [Candidatus Promineifilaceae bacterium]|nr:DUF2298 domain-containing protein [Candidatus Promineifilaceae bacterium]